MGQANRRCNRNPAVGIGAGVHYKSNAGVCDAGFGIEKDAVFNSDLLQMQVR
jgi:hypothetical protein